jgi:hypothetical protein
VLEPVERRVERPLLDPERLPADRLDPQQDAVAVLGAERAPLS